jgi:hypothetical protein
MVAVNEWTGTRGAVTEMAAAWQSLEDIDEKFFQLCQDALAGEFPDEETHIRATHLHDDPWVEELGCLVLA